MTKKKRSGSSKRVSAGKQVAVKSASGFGKRTSRKSPRTGSKSAAVLIHDGPVRFGGIARDALNVFRGGVRVALQGLSNREVAVMMKTQDGPVVGVPVMENGAFVRLRTNINSGAKSASKGAKR